ncbi:hypothetical protein Daci_0608 [Delftia acidovorans SPH-1]|uniref:Uncharacterized protein n=1 Tax=Delftia acidovorans (strain DSM 14801 / SPH-1) TaxID=398578 RepID=A9BQ39_DELAS|nr:MULTISPECIES: hypothetical protein [Delftia]ABX33254.1 hypothetical protein Daci_0608 [Delftia acidovorans SPH-1]MCP4015920.1 hypothetical protein [Delftia sp.]MCP4534816.1 hypothetical protein [Delftia sp.]QPS72153.1 hypothetical protein I6G48_15705 [Delftia acidovorans]
MQIYAAGWALQTPILNHFKRFLKINSHHLKLSGIVYPKKIPSNIEGIPVFDFNEVLERIDPSTIFIECYLPSNQELSKDFSNFFQKNNINSQKISEFLRTIIEKDSQELISTPFKHISATDIRSLHKFTPPSFISGNFLDPESYTTANTLHSIFHNSKWDALMEFDNDNSLGQFLINSLSFVQKTRFPKNYQIINSPILFLDSLIKIRQLNDSESFNIIINSTVADQLGNSLEFYKNIFQNHLTIANQPAENSESTAYLSNSTSFMYQRIKSNLQTSTAVMLMQRSIIDYHNLAQALEGQNFRISLRQVDTQPEHLISTLFS